MPVGQFRRYPTAFDLSKKGRILLILSIYYHNSVDNSYSVWVGTRPSPYGRIRRAETTICFSRSQLGG